MLTGTPKYADRRLHMLTGAGQANNMVRQRRNVSMQTRDIVGLTLIPIALLITAGTLNLAVVGSIVWFCGLVASAVLILALISFCYNYSPSTVPMQSFLLVYAASVIVVGIGMVIRISFHEELTLHRQFPLGFGGPQPRQTNWSFLIVSGIYEWLSFSGILFCVFFAARVLGKSTTSSTEFRQAPSQERLNDS